MDWEKKAVLDDSDLKFIFNKCSRTFSRWRKKGTLEDNKIGGTYYYSVQWIRALVEKLKKK